METVPLQSPGKVSNLFLTLRYGDPDAPTFLRITDANEARPLLGNVYVPFPALEIGVGKRTVTLDEGPANLVLPFVADSFTDRISAGYPHSPVYVQVIEAIESSGVTQALTIFRGRLSEAIRNPRGNPDVVELIATTWKERIDVAFGIPITHLCPWIFGGNGCFIDIFPLIETATISAIAGHTLTITGLTTHSEERYWQRGYLQIDGLRIGIRDWKSDAATTFEVVKEPPPYWDGASVDVAPGCNKSKARCVEWGNLERFAGAGRAMKNRHPIIEPKS